jgi:signal transduction histidine kinase
VTVRTRLLLAAAPTALALALLGVFAVRSVSQLGHASQTILAQNYRSVLAAQRMKEELERIDSGALFAATGQRQRGLAQQAEHRRALESELRVEEGNITEPGEGEAVAALRRGWDAYRHALDECLARPAARDVEACYFGDLEPRFRALKDRADQILAMNQDAMVLKSERARREAEQLGTWMLAAALAALAVGLATSWLLASRAVQPLAVLGRSVEQFGSGDFAVRAPTRGGAEVAQLAATFNAMADRISEYRRSSLGEMLQAQLASQAALDSLPDPVFVLAPDGAIASLNRAAEQLFPSEQRATPRVPLLAPPVRDALEAVHAHVISGKGAFAPRSFDEAFSVTGADGDRVYLPRAEPLYEEGGGIVGVTIVLQDVTRLHRFEELRNDLVSTVAHQFRTPLTSLRMAIHLCLEGVAGPLAAKQQDLLYAAREECERLQEIVDELLDLARLQSGTIQLDLEDVGADALLERAAKAFRTAAAAKGIRLEEDPLPCTEPVRADPARVQLVFSNLLENALRHTPSGGRISIGARAGDADVRFEVSDTGPGIPAELQTRVFEKFYRGPGGGTGGAGLGLSIARDVVHAHGGEIGVESEPESGSRFWFTLPISRSRAAPGEPARANTSHGK